MVSAAKAAALRYTGLMAVIVEAFSVVVRRETIQQAFHGGEAALEALAPNASGRKDDHLYSISFMDARDAEAFIKRVLVPYGLTWTRGDEAMDITIVDQHEGLWHYTPWLGVGQYPVEGGEVTAAWLAGAKPGELATHRWWDLQGYLGLSPSPLPQTGSEEDVPSAGGPYMQVTLDPETGEKRYTLRTPVAPAPIPAELVRAILDKLPKTWNVALAVSRARVARAAGREPPDLSEQEAHLESLLPILRRIGLTASGDDARTHFTEGFILAALGRLQEAEEPLRRAHALDPDSATVAGELMGTLWELGKASEGIDVARRALRMHARHPTVPVQAAALLHSVGESDEALDALNGLLAEQPDNEAALNMKRKIENQGANAD